MRLLQYVDNDAIKTEVRNRKGTESGLEGGRADEGNCTEGANC